MGAHPRAARERAAAVPGIRAPRRRPVRRAVCAGALLALAACASVPFDRPKAYSESYRDVADTRVGAGVDRWVEEHGGQSGFHPLNKGMDALGLRLALAEAAEKSIDLQYFLMKRDTAGAVMAEALLRAADRGVRVRFLLDDVFTTTKDRSLLLLNEHPNIQVRLFNPVARGGLRGLNFVTAFRRANRRMHNKSFTVDNRISIVGGRNIADEYFELNQDAEFLDFDVVALGPVVPEVSASFDRYWNHERAVPIDYLSDLRAGESLELERQEIGQQLEEAHDTVFAQALESQVLQDLLEGRREPFVADAEVLSDDPDKLLNPVAAEHMRLAQGLLDLFDRAEHEVILITPYYVPLRGGVRRVRDLVDRGVRVVVVTNSLAANNHVPVHSAYSGYRRDVLRAGVELYEARADAARELAGSEDGPERLTMHTKLVLVDRRWLFVGSLNLDPRSVEINAEMGLLIDCAALTGPFAEVLEERIATAAWRVQEEDGRLVWRGQVHGEEVVETKEPQASTWLRFKAWCLKIVPDRQL